MNLINLLLKTQIHAKTYFFFIFYVVLNYDNNLFFLSLKNLIVCMKTKYFFQIYIYLQQLLENQVFNTKFIFLQKKINHKINTL